MSNTNATFIVIMSAEDFGEAKSRSVRSQMFYIPIKNSVMIPFERIENARSFIENVKFAKVTPVIGAIGSNTRNVFLDLMGGTWRG